MNKLPALPTVRGNLSGRKYVWFSGMWWEVVAESREGDLRCRYVLCNGIEMAVISDWYGDRKATERWSIA